MVRKIPCQKAEVREHFSYADRRNRLPSLFAPFASDIKPRKATEIYKPQIILPSKLIPLPPKNRTVGKPTRLQEPIVIKLNESFRKTVEKEKPRPLKRKYTETESPHIPMNYDDVRYF